MRTGSIVAKGLHLLGILHIAAGLLFTVFLRDMHGNFSVFISMSSLLAGISSGLLFMGLSKIIVLLEGNNKDETNNINELLGKLDGVDSKVKDFRKSQK